MADNAPTEWRQSFDLPSERGSSRLVTDELLAHVGHHGWSADDIFAIHLAAEEALVNAVVHGNRLDPAKRILVECLVTPHLVRLEVTDQGEGFDPSQVPDCTLEERLAHPSGRGVMLMKSFMTRVAYNARGNSVVLEKRRGVPPESTD